MDVRRYDFEGTKTYNRMYMPSGAKLSTTKPDGITKEPHYDGHPQVRHHLHRQRHTPITSPSPSMKPKDTTPKSISTSTATAT